jgi:hypothetical protein
MKGKRLVISMLFFVLVLALAFPGTQVLANRQYVYKATLTTAAEVGGAQGNAHGSGLVSNALDGTYSFVLVVRGLSGPALAAHIHGPASESENAPVLIPLCTSTTTCTMDQTGALNISGSITPTDLMNAGITGAQFLSWLNSGMLYINVHTALNPGGEARGQLYPVN